MVPTPSWPERSARRRDKNRRATASPVSGSWCRSPGHEGTHGEHFTGPDDYVLCNAAGDRIDPTALRRRYVRARNTAKLPPLRFHDLRHTAGSLLVRQLDPASVKDILGHADLKTTDRYLHAQRASALAEAATRAFQPVAPQQPTSPLDDVKAMLAKLVPEDREALLAQSAR